MVGLSLFSLVAVVQQKTFTDPRRKKRKWPFSHRSPRSSDHSRAHFQAVRENSPLSVTVTQEEARQKLRSVSTNSKKNLLYLTVFVNVDVLIAFLFVTYERIVMWWLVEVVKRCWTEDFFVKDSGWTFCNSPKDVTSCTGYALECISVLCQSDFSVVLQIKMFYFGSDAASSHTMSCPQQYLIGNMPQLLAFIRITAVERKYEVALYFITGCLTFGDQDLNFYCIFTGLLDYQ